MPRQALVSVGHRNRFGHPHPAVAARFADRGIQKVTWSGDRVFVSDTRANVVVSTDSTGTEPAGYVAPRESALDYKLDSLVLHRGWGPLIFLAVVMLVFQSIFTWATPLMDGVEALVAGSGEWLALRLPVDTAQIRDTRRRYASWDPAEEFRSPAGLHSQLKAREFLLALMSYRLGDPAAVARHLAPLPGADGELRQGAKRATRRARNQAGHVRGWRGQRRDARSLR